MANGSEDSSAAIVARAAGDPNATTLVFGASGDLTARKLMPALFTLWQDGFVSNSAPIVGVARRENTDEGFRNEMFEAVRKHTRKHSVTRDQWQEFASRLFYRQLDLSNVEDYGNFKSHVAQLEAEGGRVG